MEDERLIDKIRKGNSQAFDLLFKKYYQSLVHYIHSFSQDIYLAEDVVQQMFVNLWINREDLKIKKSVKGYLYLVSYSSFLNYDKKVKRRQGLLEEFKKEVISDYATEDSEVLNQRINRLKQLIETLPPNCQEILKLNKFGGLKYDEIAKRMNISKKTVESQMRIAFKKIRNEFDNDKLILVFMRSFFKVTKN
ncbi:RNA polymerase sigma factor [Aestuariibaculum suncheonense]|uniref:RNA polymerase sigma-70 factor n=1 Tax=Aestuariibaculum suncheonense TaxID=1028745 RepID=A0A8J6QFU1_9FLAO|nr:RNA polymerase sigma-70 factor [Aestuariibaculum suncheonense]MBD0835377.1 RNA polymerase sigma-70 factor [Aestuariibaculum suncheonense]